MSREYNSWGRHLFTIDDSAQQEREQRTERIISGDYTACVDD